MPNPLRKSGSSLPGPKNSSQSSSNSSQNEKEEEEEKRKKKGSKNLSAAQYRAILLQSHGREKKKNKEEEKSDKKRKLTVGLKTGDDSGRGGQSGGPDAAEPCEKTGAERKSLGSDSRSVVLEELEEGEIRADSTILLEPKQDGKKLNDKVCGGLPTEECCKKVQPRGVVETRSDDKACKGLPTEECCEKVQPRGAVETGCDDDNFCVVCKLGGSGMLLGCKGKGCKKKYHRKCLHFRLKDAQPSYWRCICCFNKNTESGGPSSHGVPESNLDTTKVKLADSEGVDTSKTRVCKNKDSSDSVERLKERPLHVVASDSKFVEYWVPVKLSSVQLEQYCHILLSNSAILRSWSKPVEALRDVLISTRKCCDHPYFVDPSLQRMLTNGLSEAEYLNVGIQASGKLQALDKMLSETKKQGLRVVIIFQSNVGSSGISLGDVLDDVVHQRCGVDSYERVDRGLIVSETQFSRNKQAAMNRFNDKENGRIVFLLDRRACHPTIKLSSVDIVIMYDSDLNPNNDLKVLQKITISSQHEQLKVLRLYSLCTLEEMVLIYAKQDVTVDAQNLNHSTIHQLLRWGASNLFKQLIEFHVSSPPSSPIFSSEHLLKELFGPLPQVALSPCTNTVIVKVDQTGGTYSRDISLPGELEMQSVDEDLPHVFWTKLLNRKTPMWKYFPAASSSQRIRKRVQYFDSSLENMDVEDDDVTKKRRKVSGTIDAGAHKPVLEDKRKVGGANKEGASGTPALDCSQFLPSPAVPTGSRYRKANEISSLSAACMGDSDKLSVSQELEGKIKETHKSLQIVLPPPSEPPCPEPLVEDQIELVNNSASGSTSEPDIQLTNDIRFGHTTSQQAKYPTQPLAELPSHNVIAPAKLLPILTNGSPGGNVACASEKAIKAVQQELEREIRESHQSCQVVLPPPFEPLRPEPPVEAQVELVNTSASRSGSEPNVQPDNGIQSEPPRPEPPVEDQVELVNDSASRTGSQPDVQLNNGIQSEPPRPEPPVEDQVELVNDSASRTGSLPDVQLNDGIQSEPPRPEPPVVDLVELLDNSAAVSTSQPDVQLNDGIQSEQPCPEPQVVDLVELLNNSASASTAQPDGQLNDGIQSEQPRPEPQVVDLVELVNNSASVSGSQPDVQLTNEIQSAPLRPEPPVVDLVELVDNSVSVSGSQPDVQLNNGIELASCDVVAPLETMLQLSLGRSGKCVSDSRSVGGVPDSINHPCQNAPMTSSRTSKSLLHYDPSLNEDQVGLARNSAPQPNTQLGHGIQLGLNPSQQAEFPTQPAATVEHSEVPSYKDALQDNTPQQPISIDGHVGGSVTRVSDFRSLGVVQDCISQSLHIVPPTSSKTSQTPLVDFSYEKARILREQEQAAKLYENLHKRMKQDYYKEVQELYKKYSKLQQDNETGFAQVKKENYTKYQRVCMNEMLAKCFRDKML